MKDDLKRLVEETNRQLNESQEAISVNIRDYNKYIKFTKQLPSIITGKIHQMVFNNKGRFRDMEEFMDAERGGDDAAVFKIPLKITLDKKVMSKDEFEDNLQNDLKMIEKQLGLSYLTAAPSFNMPDNVDFSDNESAQTWNFYISNSDY